MKILGIGVATVGMLLAAPAFAAECISEVPEFDGITSQREMVEYLQANDPYVETPGGRSELTIKSDGSYTFPAQEAVPSAGKVAVRKDEGESKLCFIGGQSEDCAFVSFGADGESVVHLYFPQACSPKNGEASASTFVSLDLKLDPSEGIDMTDPKVCSSDGAKELVAEILDEYYSTKTKKYKFEISATRKSGERFDGVDCAGYVNVEGGRDQTLFDLAMQMELGVQIPIPEKQFHINYSLIETDDGQVFVQINDE